MGSIFYTLDDLKVESRRLSTFIDWPIKNDFRLTPSELAKAGFYYLRFKDHCACAFCRGIIGAWEPGDTPRGEHRRHFDHCEFLVSDGGKVNNITIEEEKLLNKAGVSALTTIGYEGLCPPSTYYAQKRREESFYEQYGRTHPYSWPFMQALHPQRMANAGFYYAGLSDHVRCFKCSLGLRNWVGEIHDPLYQHLKYSPECDYARRIRDLTLLDSEVRPFAMADDEGYACDDIINAVATDYTKTNTFVASVVASGYCDKTTCKQAVKVHFKTKRRLFNSCSELERAVNNIRGKSGAAAQGMKCIGAAATAAAVSVEEELADYLEGPVATLAEAPEAPAVDDAELAEAPEVAPEAPGIDADAELAEAPKASPEAPGDDADAELDTEAPAGSPKGPVESAEPVAAGEDVVSTTTTPKTHPCWDEEIFYNNMVYCVVCRVNIRNVVSTPCMHLASCSKCESLMLDRGKCIICNVPMSGVYVVKWA